MERKNQLMHSLREVLKQKNQATAGGKKACSTKTSQKRWEILHKSFKELREMGFKLNHVNGFKEKHVHALAQRWEASGQSSSTIQNKISIFRTFSEWIGKGGLVKESTRYVTNPDSAKRSLIADRDKSWTGNGVDPVQKIAEVAQKDERVAVQLMLQATFALRTEEAAKLKPHQADRGTHLAIVHGTKGGRSRTVDIEKEYPAQRLVLEHAKQLSSLNGSTIPEGMTWSQWRDHYYYVLNSCGISKKDGITAHGLRHERLHEIYRKETQQLAPVQGGVVVNSELDKFARQKVAEVAGHARQSISSAYLGK